MSDNDRPPLVERMAAQMAVWDTSGSARPSDPSQIWGMLSSATRAAYQRWAQELIAMVRDDQGDPGADRENPPAKEDQPRYEVRTSRYTGEPPEHRVVRIDRIGHGREVVKYSRPETAQEVIDFLAARAEHEMP